MAPAGAQLVAPLIQVQSLPQRLTLDTWRNGRFAVGRLVPVEPANPRG
jgi:hypothetical protein